MNNIQGFDAQLVYSCSFAPELGMIKQIEI